MHRCFHRFNVHFTGVTDPTNTNSPSAHLSVANWTNIYEYDTFSDSPQQFTQYPHNANSSANVLIHQPPLIQSQSFIYQPPTLSSIYFAPPMFTYMYFPSPMYGTPSAASLPYMLIHMLPTQFPSALSDPSHTCSHYSN